MGKRAERERQQSRKYYRAMEEMRASEKDRLTALGMMLDATWDGKFFVQRREAGGHAVVCYYDKRGNVVAPNARELWDQGRSIPSMPF